VAVGVTHDLLGGHHAFKGSLDRILRPLARDLARLGVVDLAMGLEVLKNLLLVGRKALVPDV
jgi:hypothetical protein